MMASRIGHIPVAPMYLPPVKRPQETPSTDSMAAVGIANEQVTAASATQAKVKALECQQRIHEKEQQQKKNTTAYTIRKVTVSDRTLLSATIRQFPLIHVLNLRGCTILSRLDFAEISKLTGLEELILRTCKGVTIEAIALLKNLSFLSLIDIRDCSGLGENEWLELSILLPRCRIRKNLG